MTTIDYLITASLIIHSIYVLIVPGQQ